MKYITFQRKVIKLRIVFILLFVLFTSCDRVNSKDETYFKEYGSLLWVNNTMPDSIVKKAVKETLENSSMIIAQVHWNPNPNTIIENINWYSNLAKEHGKNLMINVDWLNNDRKGTSGGWSFDNEEVKSQFTKDIYSLVKLYKPQNLTLGVEVNYYAITSTKGYKAFVEVFNSIKDSLKKTNPKLKVGLSFQLELLYGVDKERMSGKTLQPLNTIVKNLDYIGVSTYPDLYGSYSEYQFKSLNYIDSLVYNYNKPIGITEIGISSTNFNDTQRMAYIDFAFSKMSNLSFIIWGSMIDDKKNESWMDRIGLLNPDGSPKIEYQKWLNNINTLK